MVSAGGGDVAGRLVRIGQVVKRERAEQRRLAVAVGAEQRDAVVGIDAQRHAHMIAKREGVVLTPMLKVGGGEGLAHFKQHKLGPIGRDHRDHALALEGSNARFARFDLGGDV